MTLNRFLGLVLPTDSPLYRGQALEFYPKSDDPKAKKSDSRGEPMADSPAKLAHLLQKLDVGRNNVYIAMAGFAAGTPHIKGRRIEYVDAYACHWFDFDVKDTAYASLGELLTDLFAFCTEVGIPVPLLVRSGVGVHAYLPYTEILGPEEWTRVARKFVTVIKHWGIDFDGGVTVDAVHLMRLPGSHHRKPPEYTEHPVEFLYPDSPLQWRQHDFDTVEAKLDAYIADNPDCVVAPPAASKPVDPDDEWSTGSTKAPYSYDECECNIVKWHRWNGGAGFTDANGRTWKGMHNTNWFNVLNIAKFSEEGEAAAYEDAAQYPGYSEAETRDALKRNERSGVRCSQMQLNSTSYDKVCCDACQYRGKIVTPVHAQPQVQPEQPQPQPAPDQAAANGGSTYPSNPPPNPLDPANQPTHPAASRYENTVRGLYVIKPPTKTNPDPVRLHLCTHQLMAMRPQRDNVTDSMGYECWFRSHNAYATADVRDVIVVLPVWKQPIDAIAVLENARVVVMRAHWKEYMAYLNKWIAGLQTQIHGTTYSRFGWQDDRSFIHASKRFANGAITPVALTKTQADDNLLAGTCGDPAKWRAVVQQFCTRQDEWGDQALFGLALGFAPPLVKARAQFTGATFVITAPGSGRGKSFIGQMAASVSAHPKHSAMSAQNASSTSVANRLGRLPNSLMYLDETGNSKIEHLQQLAFMIAEGKLPERASTDGTNREIKTWATLGIVTSNTSLYGMLELADTQVNDGVLARLIELELAEVDYKGDNALMDTLMENWGWGMEPWLQYLTANYEEVMAATRARADRMMADCKTNTERLWVSAFADVLEAGWRIQQLGICYMDYARLERYCYYQLARLRQRYLQTVHDPHENLRRIIAEMLVTITVHCDEQGIDPSRNPHFSHEGMLARYDIHRHRFYVQKQALNARLGANWRTIIKRLTTDGLILPVSDTDDRFRIYNGVKGMATTRVRGYLIDMAKLDGVQEVQDNVTPLHTVGP